MYTSFIPGKRDGLTINMKHRHKALLKVHFYARYFTYDIIRKNEEFSYSDTHPLLHPASVSEYYNGKLAHFFRLF